jgi:hypothetical protein
MVRILSVIIFFASFLATSALLATSSAYADPPPGHGNKPDEPPGIEAPQCHGRNDVDCRADPQPERGQDCIHSDDHVCSTNGDIGNAGGTSGEDDVVIVDLNQQPEAIPGSVMELPIDQGPSALAEDMILIAPEPIAPQIPEQFTAEVLGTSITPPKAGDAGLAAAGGKANSKTGVSKTGLMAGALWIGLAGFGRHLVRRNEEILDLRLNAFKSL